MSRVERHLQEDVLNSQPNTVNEKKAAGMSRILLSLILDAGIIIFLLLNMKTFVKDGHVSMLVFYLIIAAVFAAFVTIIFEKIRTARNSEGLRSFGEGADSVLLRLMFLATPFLCFFVHYKDATRSATDVAREFLNTSGRFNFAIIVCLLLLMYLITNRVRMAVVLTTLINGAFVFTNIMLIQFRGEPLLANDIFELKTALQVADSYSVTFDRTSIYCIVISLLWISLAFGFRGHKGLAPKKRLVILLVTALLGGGLYGVIFHTNYLSNKGIKVSGWKPHRSYAENGYYLSFLITIKQASIEKPEGYSLEAVEAIAANYTSDEADSVTKTNKKTPNVIVIMNESFSDLEVLGEIETNKEVIPFYNSLKKDTIKGTMHSSIYGGHTAVSEFECLTGFSDRFLPLNSIPYTSVIRSETPSQAWNFKARNYGGLVAFHPGYAASYNRDETYPRLGFDEHISSEDMQDPDRVRGFISDKADYERLIQEYEAYRESGEARPYYMFNVTIQNHGGYKLSNGEVKPRTIETTDVELETEESEQFLNLMKISDNALKDLIGYFKDVKEPTVIMMFGDHQPRLDDKFYKVLNERAGRTDEFDKKEVKQIVPFMIWANYDIPEETGIEISANFMMPYLLDLIEAPMTGFDKYMMDLYEKTPVLTLIETVDADGKIYKADEETPYDDMIREYQCLQYNALADKKNTLTEFFSLK